MGSSATARPFTYTPLSHSTNTRTIRQFTGRREAIVPCPWSGRPWLPYLATLFSSGRAGIRGAVHLHSRARPSPIATASAISEARRTKTPQFDLHHRRQISQELCYLMPPSREWAFFFFFFVSMGKELSFGSGRFVDLSTCVLRLWLPGDLCVSTA